MRLVQLISTTSIPQTALCQADSNGCWVTWCDTALQDTLRIIAVYKLVNEVQLYHNPYVDRYCGGAPEYKLLFNDLLAGFNFPLHSWFERVLKRKLIKKRIR